MKMPQRTLGLRLTLILLVLVPITAVFGAGGWMLLDTLESELEERLQDDIALIARTLSEPMARAVQLERERTVARTLQSATEFGRVYGVYVYDADGELITGADRQAGQSAPSEITSSDLDVASGGDYRSVGGEEVYSYFIPLTGAGGQTVGMLQVTRQASEMRDYLRELRLQVIGLVLGFSLLFIVILFLGHHVAIGRALNRLSSSMSSVTQGDTSVRAVPGGPQEIRQLGRQFNTMLDGIVDRDARLADERERQMRLEARLRQSEKYALVGRLAAGVAHELGTPLSVIDGHAQRLLREADTDSRAAKTLQRIRDAAERMAVVVQQLLGFGRGAASDNEPVQLQRLVSLAAADVRAFFESGGTALEISPGKEETTVRGDEGRLREALAHLLKNAAHAASGRKVRIRWAAGDIFIDDSGPGISATDRERVFEPFYTTKAPGEGSGLGLAVVRGILADFGAEIHVSDSDLGGACFHIVFPEADEMQGAER